MSLTVSQDEGVTLITIISNSNSKCPILCQILGSLCYSPVCAVSQHVKLDMMDFYMALGIVIIAGVLNLVTGILFINSGMHDHIMMFNAPFWLGGVFLVVGVVSIVADQFPSYFLLLVTVVLNKVSALLAMIGLALYAWDLMGVKITSDHYYGNMTTTREALDVTMMIISALHLCVTLSFSVLTLKELCETNSVEDLHLYKPLKEVAQISSICNSTIFMVSLDWWTLADCFWSGLDEGIAKRMPLAGSRWTLPNYINLARSLSGSHLLTTSPKASPIRSIHHKIVIIAGVLNLVTGILFINSGMHDHIMMFNAPFWLGGVFLVVGVVSIVADQFPSYFLLLVTVVLNKVSALLAMIGLALYAWDLMGVKITSDHYYGNMTTTREALDVTMMIISALHLCVTLSFSVLTLKELCETNSVEDLHLYKPLKEVAQISSICNSTIFMVSLDWWTLADCFWSGLDEGIAKRMPLAGSRWTLPNYINLARSLSGSHLLTTSPKASPIRSIHHKASPPAVRQSSQPAAHQSSLSAIRQSCPLAARQSSLLAVPP